MGDVEDSLLDDIALADSFINFDYVPDPGPDPNVVGSGSPHSGCAGDFGIEEAIERICLLETEGNGSGDVRVEIESEIIAADVESKSLISENAATTSSSTSSETSIGSDSDVKTEVEEGEIEDSDGDDDDDDDDSEERSEEVASRGVLDDDDVGRPVISKNELVILPWVPPVSLTLGPHHQMLPVGGVMSIVGAQVIVEGVEKHDPLSEGSILWMTERQRPLGLIDEIFGPVKNPYYIVRYNSENEVPEGIRGGTLISFVPEFANHVLNDEELYQKGYDEEISNDSEFSDDGKEAEYKRMQRMAKRGIKDQNPGKRENNREKVPSATSLPVEPATSLPDHGHHSSIPGIAQGHFSASNVNPPCPPNVGPNLTTSGVWTNGTTLPQQFAVLPNGFPTNGVSWYPGNTQISHQSPTPGIPFQQQLNPVFRYSDNTQFSHQLPTPGAPFQKQLNPVHGYPDNTQISHQLPVPSFPFQQQLNLVHGYPVNTQISQQFPVPGTPFQQQFNPVHGFDPATIFSGVQPNINAQPMYAQRPVNQNQITVGLSTPFPQVQPSSFTSGNQHAPHQYNPGASANHGRKTRQQRSNRSWRRGK